MSLWSLLCKTAVSYLLLLGWMLFVRNLPLEWIHLSFCLYTSNLSEGLHKCSWVPVESVFNSPHSHSLESRTHQHPITTNSTNLSCWSANEWPYLRLKLRSLYLPHWRYHEHHSNYHLHARCHLLQKDVHCWARALPTQINQLSWNHKFQMIY